MSFNRPFHRNYRPVKEGPNSGYSDWAYIIDHQYAEHPEHYTRAFALIQADILKLFEYIEPSDMNNLTYSFRIHELLLRICVEVELNFKAILRENIYFPIVKSGRKQGQIKEESDWNIHDFQIVNRTHHLDNYSIKLPFWKGMYSVRKPFYGWQQGNSLIWYQAYNQTKHERLKNFESANLQNMIDAFCGLFALLSSQFKTESFAHGTTGMAYDGNSFFNGDFGIGEYLMVNFPSNWKEEELYDFDWAHLKNANDRFSKFDYSVFF